MNLGADTLRHEVRDTSITRAGVELAIRDYGGAGPALLLIPGGGRTLADWTPMAPFLLHDHRVVAMDMRGHGHSGDGPWNWGEVLEDTRAVVSALELEPVTIVGHSLGGMIAALYGERLPGIRAAVNVDGHGSGRRDQYVGIPPEEVEARMAEMREMVKQMQEAQPASLTSEEVQTSRDTTLAAMEASGLGAAAAEAFDRTLAQLPDGRFQTRPTQETTTALLAEVERLDLFATYRRVACPLLIYNAIAAGPEQPGLPDWLGPFQAAFRSGLRRDLAALAAECDHVEVQTIDATHALILEQPELIAEQVVAFVARNG